MRRLVTTIIMFAIALSVAGCSGGEPNTMPDVVGKRLDIALSDVERAGFDDEVEVLGGGAFGVLDESNWTVCSQEPESGAEIAGVPRISVDRTCDTDDSMNPQATQKDEDTDEEQAATAPAKPKKKKRKPAAPVADTFVMPALVGMNLQEAQNALQDRGSFLLTET